MPAAVSARAIRIPNVGIAFGFFLKRLKKFGLNTVLKVEFDQFDFSFMQNCNESFSRLSFNDGSLASTKRLSAEDVRNAPKASRIP